jgi:hypothetical protein
MITVTTAAVTRSSLFGVREQHSADGDARHEHERWRLVDQYRSKPQ